LPNKRDLRLDKYGISKHRYGELKDFCLQYQEWRDELQYNTDTVHSKVITDMPICHGTGNPMETLIERRLELENKCEMVEQSLIKAVGDLYNGEMEELYPRMLKAIINDNINFAYLDEVCNIPCGCSKYWQIRRYFFFLLSQRRK
jgi:hypothetical protein